MRIFHIFISGVMVIGLGIAALQWLDAAAAIDVLRDAVMIGGGIIICSLFALKFRWHGLAGAGVVGLLGFGRGLADLYQSWQLSNGLQGSRPAIELGITLICLLLMLRVLRALRCEQARLRALAEEEGATRERQAPGD